MFRLGLFSLATFFGSTVYASEPLAPQKGLAVHEWGVFRVNDDVDFANAYLRAEWDDLPEFAYGYIKGRVVPQHWGAFEERAKPILFFHAEKPTQMRVKVDFPGGMAGVWFPATEHPAVFANSKQPKVGSKLEWNLGVKQVPQGWRPKTPAPPAVPEKHWIARIRQVKSDELFARYSPSPIDVEREKFIYYDGLFPQTRWMKITVEKNRVGLISQVKHPVLDITVVDRRGDKVRVGRIVKLDAGATVKEVAFAEIETALFATEATDTLLKQLGAAGLFKDEALALTDLWQKRLFETPGLHLFYRLPQEIYDALMPLTLTPKPDSVVRVGLVVHSHLEPDFADRIFELVQNFNSPKFVDRDNAWKRLLAIGPAALAQLQKLRQRKELSVEVRERIDTLVKKWNAVEAFDK